ncbi:hypothetical protein G6F35_011155 [Rhizopus arrhizus]|nr:hypothetical protein G6F35_011155 [Rhizopus arrhizus]
MVVWFASGLSLADWLRPVLRVAIPIALAVAGLTLVAAPWAYRQIGEYHERFEQRSDLSKVTAGQFAESSGGNRVFFSEDPATPSDELGNVFAREIGPEWLSVLTASSAHSETLPNGDRFLVLGEGHRYDLKPGTPEIRLVHFDNPGRRRAFGQGPHHHAADGGQHRQQLVASDVAGVAAAGRAEPGAAGHSSGGSEPAPGPLGRPADRRPGRAALYEPDQPVARLDFQRQAQLRRRGVGHPRGGGLADRVPAHAPPAGEGAQEQRAGIAGTGPWPRFTPRPSRPLRQVFHRAALAGQEVGILQYRFPDELPQDRHALELAQVFMAVHPERTRDLHLVLQHRFQPRVLRGDEARQDRQRLALQGRVVLRDHARAA